MGYEILNYNLYLFDSDTNLKYLFAKIYPEQNKNP